MVIAVKCLSCNWQGNAEVGRRKGGVPLSEQQCPKCSSDIKRRTGTYNIGDEFADIKELVHNEVLHQQIGVDGWQEIYADAPSEEDVRQEMAEDMEKEKNEGKAS